MTVNAPLASSPLSSRPLLSRELSYFSHTLDVCYVYAKIGRRRRFYPVLEQPDREREN